MFLYFSSFWVCFTNFCLSLELLILEYPGLSLLDFFSIHMYSLGISASLYGPMVMQTPPRDISTAHSSFLNFRLVHPAAYLDTST